MTRGRISALLVTLALTLAPQISQADKLCLRKVQRVQRGRLQLKKVLRTEEACPAGFLEVLDTAEFQGPQGPAGMDGADGLDGNPGATNVTIRRSNGSVNANSTKNLIVQCEAGEKAVGGGAGLTNGSTSEFSIWSTRPVDAEGNSPLWDTAVPTGWAVGVRNSGANSQSFTVWVVCAAP